MRKKMLFKIQRLNKQMDELIVQMNKNKRKHDNMNKQKKEMKRKYTS